MSLLELDGVKVHFPVKKGLLFDRTVGHVYAVDGVSLKVEAGQTYGLVGESGCGKTTLGRAVLRLVDITDGSVVFDGTDLAALPRSRCARFRRRLQMVFQDPLGSLNPRQNIESILTEGMLAHGIGDDQEDRRNRIKAILERVGLPSNALSRYPHEFSAGSASASGSPARSSSNRTSSSATSRSPRWTCRSRRRSSTAGGAPGAARADVPGHRPRPGRRPAHLGRHRRHVPRLARRGGPRATRCTSRRSTRTRAPSCRRSPSPTRRWRDRRERILLHGDLPPPAAPLRRAAASTRGARGPSPAARRTIPELTDTGDGHRVVPATSPRRSRRGTLAPTRPTGPEAVTATIPEQPSAPVTKAPDRRTRKPCGGRALPSCRYGSSGGGVRCALLPVRGFRRGCALHSCLYRGLPAAGARPALLPVRGFGGAAFCASAGTGLPVRGALRVPVWGCPAGVPGPVPARSLARVV